MAGGLKAHVFDAVDAEGEEVVENPAGFLDVGDGAVGGEGFAHGAGGAVEMGGGGGEFGIIGDDIVPDLMPDGVDAGDLDGAEAFEEVAVGDGELGEDFLVFDVHLHFDVVLGAPFSFTAEEVFAEKIGPDIAVVGEDAVGGVEGGRGSGGGRGGGGRGAAAGGEADGGDGGEVGAEVVAFAFLEFLKEDGGPGVEAVGGFIAAEAEDGFSEFVPDGVFVGVEGPVVEELIGFGVEVIHDGVFVIFLAVGIVGGACGSGAEGPADVDDFPISVGGVEGDGAGGGVEELGVSGVEVVGGEADGFWGGRGGEGFSGGERDAAAR